MPMVHNVRDGRRGWIGSWRVEPLVYDALRLADVGRTVIYRDWGHLRDSTKGTAEAGTLSSWKGGIVFARYSRGDTAAGANAEDLCFGVEALDTPEAIRAAISAETPR